MHNCFSVKILKNLNCVLAEDTVSTCPTNNNNIICFIYKVPFSSPRSVLGQHVLSDVTFFSAIMVDMFKQLYFYFTFYCI